MSESCQYCGHDGTLCMELFGILICTRRAGHKGAHVACKSYGHGANVEPLLIWSSSGEIIGGSDVELANRVP